MSSKTLPPPRVFWAIAKKAESQTAAFAREYATVLIEAYKRAAEELRQGSTVDSFVDKFASVLQEELIQLKIRWAFAFAIDAYKLAGTLLGRKSLLATYQNRKVVPTSARAKELTIDVEAFGSDWLIAAQVKPQLAKWIENTSQLESLAISEELAAVVRGGIASGSTISEIASGLIESTAALTQQRAEMLARTTTNWCYNEGAVSQYEASGFGQLGWSATDDDATCEFCMALDGKTFSLRTIVVASGDSLSGLDGGSMTAGIDVEHPPLHPHCRCTILPVE